MKTEPTSRQKQALETKKNIAEAVLKLCTTMSFQKIIIADICKEAQVSVGCFYHHFKSKEEVLAWSYTDFDNDLKVAVEAYGHDHDPLDMLLFIAREYYGFLITQDISYTISAYRSQLTLGDTYMAAPDRYFDEAISSVAQRIIDDGNSKKQWEVDKLTSFILRCIRGVAYDWCSRNGSYDIIAQGEEDLKMIFSAL